MMAQMLNSPVEMLDPSAPFQVVLDELAIMRRAILTGCWRKAAA